MVYCINSAQAGNSAAHALSDFSELLLTMRPDNPRSYLHRLSDECYKLGTKQEHYLVEETPQQVSYASTSLSSLEEEQDNHSTRYETRNALSISQIFDLFRDYVISAKSIDDDMPMRAFAALQEQLKNENYSGIGGSIAKSLHTSFGWFDFNDTADARKLKTVFTKLNSLKITPKMDIPKIIVDPKNSSSLGKRVFTDSIRDSEAIGTIAYGSAEIQWMQPGEYLRRVDPYFRRHDDEDSLPFLLESMADLANGKKSEPKFAPLMMNPSKQQNICEGYTILEHEGRHRAFAAMRLGIPFIPVAIFK